MFGEETASNRSVLHVMRVRVGTDQGRRRDILVGVLAMRRCHRARDWRRGWNIGGGFGERLESELQCAKGTECRECGDVPGGVLDDDGLVREVVRVSVNTGHLCVWVRRWRRRGQVGSAVVVVRSIFHAPCGGGGRSRRVC